MILPSIVAMFLPDYRIPFLTLVDVIAARHMRSQSIPPELIILLPSPVEYSAPVHRHAVFGLHGTSTNRQSSWNV